MIIGGGYTSDLAAKETRSPIFNESQNGLSNKRGMLAMIRDPASTHSATSQFFINLTDNPSFDCRADAGQLEYQSAGDGDNPAADAPAADAPQPNDEAWGYCVFGQVIAGMEIVDRIAQAPVATEGDFAKLPVQPITITAVEQLR
jgi:cyclophilin family peptidyl-prolyl cis-trans isomerase